MIVLRDSASIREPNIEKGSELRRLIADHVEHLNQYEGYSLEELVVFIVLEPSDTAAMLETELGISVLVDIPCWEFLDEHATCYEMMIILDDSGYGAEIFIPKVNGIDMDILSLCQLYATPAQEHFSQ